MTKTPMTAADKDALIAEAAAAGLTVTRTSKDFFLGESEGRQRVTPGEIKRLILQAQQEAEAEEVARAEALALADELRAEEQEGTAVEEAPVAEPMAELEAAPAASTPAPTAEKASKVVIKWGPPCGGNLAGLAAAACDEGRNPIVHLGFTPSSTHKTKEAAAAAGRQACKSGWLAALAQDHEGAQFWVVACLNERGHLVLDGQEVRLEPLTGQEAEAYRQKVQGARNQAKAQWVAQAV
ncbi:hypothetical protein Dcar01_02418 [Deinococcus carri]|uniref:Uncharacterized protein n=1 Tax=Deinococcus carri TaxID=1211323 RepID=A0ABP9W8J6_9DEIO